MKDSDIAAFLLSDDDENYSFNNVICDFSETLQIGSSDTMHGSKKSRKEGKKSTNYYSIQGKGLSSYDIDSTINQQQVEVIVTEQELFGNSKNGDVKIRNHKFNKNPLKDKRPKNRSIQKGEIKKSTDASSHNRNYNKDRNNNRNKNNNKSNKIDNKNNDDGGKNKNKNDAKKKKNSDMRSKLVDGHNSRKSSKKIHPPPEPLKSRMTPKLKASHMSVENQDLSVNGMINRDKRRSNERKKEKKKERRSTNINNEKKMNV